MPDPDAVIAAIDGALTDFTVGRDAMRWTPDLPADEATPERPYAWGGFLPPPPRVRAGETRVFFGPVGTPIDGDGWIELEGVTAIGSTPDTIINDDPVGVREDRTVDPDLLRYQTQWWATVSTGMRQVVETYRAMAPAVLKTVHSFAHTVHGVRIDDQQGRGGYPIKADRARCRRCNPSSNPPPMPWARGYQQKTRRRNKR